MTSRPHALGLSSHSSAPRRPSRPFRGSADRASAASAACALLPRRRLAGTAGPRSGAAPSGASLSRGLAAAAPRARVKLRPGRQGPSRESAVNGGGSRVPGWLRAPSAGLCLLCDRELALYSQITLSTVLRRKKKCIRYLQGEGRCASPVSSDGSAIDSPPSPLDALQCISSAFPSDKLAAPADSAHSEQADPFPVSAHLQATTCSSRLASRSSSVPTECPAHSTASTGT